MENINKDFTSPIIFLQTIYTTSSDLPEGNRRQLAGDTNGLILILSSPATTLRLLPPLAIKMTFNGHLRG